MYPEVKIFHRGVFYGKYDTDFPRITRIYIGEVRLLGKNGVNPFPLLMLPANSATFDNAIISFLLFVDWYFLLTSLF